MFFIVICFIEREWYIFDEPFAGVDEEGKKIMVKIIKDIIARDKNVIITSHEVEPLKYFNDINIIEIIDGKL